MFARKPEAKTYSYDLAIAWKEGTRFQPVRSITLLKLMAATIMGRGTCIYVNRVKSSAPNAPFAKLSWSVNKDTGLISPEKDQQHQQAIEAEVKKARDEYKAQKAAEAPAPSSSVAVTAIPADQMAAFIEFQKAQAAKADANDAPF